jgi:hypothetical protein
VAEGDRRSRTHWKDYRDDAYEVLERYRDERDRVEQCVRFNILYSNTETLKPAVYAQIAEARCAPPLRWTRTRWGRWEAKSCSAASPTRWTATTSMAFWKGCGMTTCSPASPGACSLQALLREGRKGKRDRPRLRGGLDRVRRLGFVRDVALEDLGQGVVGRVCRRFTKEEATAIFGAKADKLAYTYRAEDDKDKARARTTRPVSGRCGTNAPASASTSPRVRTNS